jgi:hypothetical protein
MNGGKLQEEIRKRKCWQSPIVKIASYTFLQAGPAKNHSEKELIYSFSYDDSSLNAFYVCA